VCHQKNGKKYIYNPKKNEFEHHSRVNQTPDWIEKWLEL
jgi:hypothetical protein